MTAPSSPVQAEPSLDLVNLVRFLWEKKFVIVACAVATTLLGAVYAFLLAKPVYETRIYFLPPQTGDYAPLNVERSKEAGMPPFDQEAVFQYTVNRLGSSSLMQRFLRDRDPALAKLDTIPAKELARNDWRVTVQAPNPRGRNLYLLTVAGNSIDESYDGLRHYLQLLEESTTRALIADAADDITFLKEKTDRLIDQARTVAENQRKDRIAQLREAIAVAGAGNVQDPDINVQQPGSRRAGGDSGSGGGLRPYYADGGELYTRGVRLLSAELKALQSRENDDPFIPRLREYESARRQLEQIKYDPAVIHGFRLDGDIIRPDAPVRPNKPLILFLAALLGIGAGVAYLLLRLAIDKK